MTTTLQGRGEECEELMVGESWEKLVIGWLSIIGQWKVNGSSRSWDRLRLGRQRRHRIGLPVAARMGGRAAGWKNMLCGKSKGRWVG